MRFHVPYPGPDSTARHRHRKAQSLGRPQSRGYNRGQGLNSSRPLSAEGMESVEAMSADKIPTRAASGPLAKSQEGESTRAERPASQTCAWRSTSVDALAKVFRRTR